MNVEKHDSIKVSFCVTVYNSAETIRTMLGSLKTDLDSEIIVVDNKSVDGTDDIVERINSNDIQLIRRKCNRGEGRNIAIEHASGDLVVMVDADVQYNGIDEFIKDYLEMGTGKIVSYADTDPDTRAIMPLTISWRDTIRKLGMYGRLSWLEDSYLTEVARRFNLYLHRKRQLPFRPLSVNSLQSGMERRYSRTFLEKVKRRFVANRDILFVNPMSLKEFKQFLKLSGMSGSILCMIEYILAKCSRITIKEESIEERIERISGDFEQN